MCPVQWHSDRVYTARLVSECVFIYVTYFIMAWQNEIHCHNQHASSFFFIMATGWWNTTLRYQATHGQTKAIGLVLHILWEIEHGGNA